MGPIRESKLTTDEQHPPATTTTITTISTTITTIYMVDKELKEVMDSGRGLRVGLGTLYDHLQDLIRPDVPLGLPL